MTSKEESEIMFLLLVILSFFVNLLFRKNDY